MHLAYYLDWIYTRNLPTFTNRSSSLFGAKVTLPASYDDLYIILAHLYVLGARMLDTHVQKELTEEVIRIMDIESSPESRAAEPGMSSPFQAVSIISQGTTSTSPARRLLVDWCLAFGHQAQYNMLHEKEFLLDLAVSFCTKVEK